MNILALETTEKFGSIALLNDEQLIAEISLPKDQRSSQTLHPALKTIFEEAQLTPTDVDLVAVVAGPGSFTGLRIGITAAKVFAYSCGAKVIALDTFQTVASAISTHDGAISVGVDAQRGEVVAAVLRRTAQGFCEMVKPPELMSLDKWWMHAEHDENVLFTGPALERWNVKAPPYIVLAEESYWFPQASAAGKLAAIQSLSKQFDDVWTLLPIYSRLSAAEERRNLK